MCIKCMEDKDSSTSKEFLSVRNLLFINHLPDPHCLTLLLSLSQSFVLTNQLVA